MVGSIIDNIILEIIRVEGSQYTNDPSDKGGPTKYGITQKALSEFYGRHASAEEVKALTETDAFNIYWSRYVTRPKFHLLAAVNARIAAEVIDTGVNMGPSVAAKYLQRSLNALNHNQKHPTLVVDGLVGPVTAEALKTFLGYRGVEGEFVLLTTLNALQGARYLELTEANESQKKFFYGWINQRVSAQLKDYVKERV